MMSIAVFRAAQVEVLLRGEGRQKIGQEALGHCGCTRDIGLGHETGEIGTARPCAGHALGGNRSVARRWCRSDNRPRHRRSDCPQAPPCRRTTEAERPAPGLAVTAAARKKGGRGDDRPRAVEHDGGFLLASIGGESQVAEDILQHQSIADRVAGGIGEAQRHHLRRLLRPPRAGPAPRPSRVQFATVTGASMDKVGGCGPSPRGMV
jgi:hypothetical protein